MTTTVRERPILFRPELVKAILEGRKTQTRRILRPQPPDYLNGRTFDRINGDLWGALAVHGTAAVCRAEDTIRCPFGTFGDQLYVRESYWFRPDDGITVYDDGAMCLHPTSIMGNGRGYLVPPSKLGIQGTDMRKQGFRRKPGIHMPRWACRLILEVTGVRVERLQEITEEGALAEGVVARPRGSGGIDNRVWYEGATHPVKGSPKVFYAARDAFETLWDTVNAKRGAGWAANPWVWVVTFQRATP